MNSSFLKLKKLSLTQTIYTSISQLLEWDQETYMPPEGIEIRSQQLEHLASLIHKQKTSKAFTNTLALLVDLHTGNPWDATTPFLEKAALRLWHQEWKRASALPSFFV